MKKTYIAPIIVISVLISLFSGCKKPDKYTVELPTGPVASSIRVEAVPDISDDFIRGMDASSVLVEENSRDFLLLHLC